MIMSRFRSMGLAAGAAASVLSCYMVSLRVSRERGEVQRLEEQIVETHRDIRDLNTELGTRGRMRQLERWNADVLALSAPKAAQFLDGAAELASYDPAPVVRVASATSAAAPRVMPDVVETRPVPPALPSHVVTASYAPPAVAKPAAGLLHTASFVTTKPAGATRVALLDDGVLGDIGRAAAHESKANRKAAQ